MSKARIILIVSLIINVLLIGFVIGQNIGQRSSYFPQPKEMSLLPLSDSSKKIITQALADTHKRTIPLRKKIKRLRAESFQLLSQEKFNEAKFVENMNRINSLHQRTHQELTNTIVKVSEQLNPSERKTFMTLLHKRKKR